MRPITARFTCLTTATAGATFVTTAQAPQNSDYAVAGTAGLRFVRGGRVVGVSRRVMATDAQRVASATLIGDMADTEGDLFATLKVGDQPFWGPVNVGAMNGHGPTVRGTATAASADFSAGVHRDLVPPPKLVFAANQILTVDLKSDGTAPVVTTIEFLIAILLEESDAALSQ